MMSTSPSNTDVLGVEKHGISNINNINSSVDEGMATTVSVTNTGMILEDAIRTPPTSLSEVEDDDDDDDEGTISHHSQDVLSRTAEEQQQHVEEGPAFRQVLTRLPREAPTQIPSYANNNGSSHSNLAVPASKRLSLRQSENSQSSDSSTLPTSQDSDDSHRSSIHQIIPPFEDPRVTQAALQERLMQRTEPQAHELRRLYQQHQRQYEQQHYPPPASSTAAATSMHTTRHNFILVSGPAGTGKSRLVKQALAPLVEKDGGYFLEGRYDSLQRPVPYHGLVTALSAFTSDVKERGQVMEMKKRILGSCQVSKVCDNQAVLTSMIPALDGILGYNAACCPIEKARKSEVRQSSNEDPLQRFIFAFTKFVKAIARPQQPIVLVLQNLQYADPCTLDLVVNIARTPGLILVGTCDPTEVSPDSYLAGKLRDLEDAAQQPLANVALPSLATMPELYDILQDSMCFSPTREKDAETCHRLTRLAHLQTEGNLFHVVEFVRWMQESDYLVYHNHHQQARGEWTLSRPEEMDVIVPLVQPRAFLQDKVQQLASESKELVKVCACLGTSIDPEILEYVLDYPVDKLLKDLVKRGFLRGATGYDGTSMLYQFLHDGIQQEAYQLIDEPQLFHLEIGRRLWRKLSATQLDDKLFVVLSHIYMGRRLVRRENERVAIANLCLHAGKKAARSSTFRTAAVYLQMGISLLDQRSCWIDPKQYDLTLALYIAAAEMTMCQGRFEETYALLEPVFQNARTLEDKLQAYTTKMYALSQDDHQQECMDVGICVLEKLGECFPGRLCMAHLMQEMRSVNKLLKGKSNEFLLRMPHITDSNKLSALQVLNFMVLPAIIQRPRLAPFVFLKCMKITLLHGSSVFASGAYSTYGMLVSGALGDVEKGARFGELALRSLDQFGVYEYLPRVYTAVYGCIHSWTRPMDECLEPLLHAYRVGMQSGDAEYGGLCANLYCYLSMDAGVPMENVLREWSGIKESLQSTRQTYLIRQFLPALQVIHHFMGKTEDPLAEKGDIIDYKEYEQEALRRGDASSASSMKCLKIMLGYIFLDIEFAEQNTVTCQEVWEMPPTYERIRVIYYCGLVAVQAAREGRDKRQNRRKAQQVIKYLKQKTRESPHNCLNRLSLLQAEFASLEGKNKKAYEKFLIAIAIANDKQDIMGHALSCERFYRHLLRLKERTEAKEYLVRSIRSYEKWGGMAKVVRLQDEMETEFGNGDCSTSHAWPSHVPAVGPRRVDSGLSCAQCPN